MEKKIRKLVHVSSVAAIGRNPFDEKVNENTPWENQSGNSKYSISKFLAEREVWRAIAEGLNAVIVNPSLIIGTGNWDDGSPEMFTRVWNGLFAYTEGGTGIVAARDVVNVMIHLMKSDISNERFILSAEDWSFKDLFFLIADQLHVKRPWLNVRPWMMDFFWRTEQMKQLFLRKKPLISRETARAATRWSHFDNTKVIRATNYTFTPIKTYIEEIAAKFLDEKRAAITG
jgi:nucleoside-diphosphate-sugar epimerase